MSKYRFKTEEEFKNDDLWIDNILCKNGGNPKKWCNDGAMNKYMGQEISDVFNKNIEIGEGFYFDDWTFRIEDITDIAEVNLEETLEQLKQLNQNSLITKKTMKKSVKKTVINTTEKFVYMDKTVSVLNVGYSTQKNVILYGPGE